MGLSGLTAWAFLVVSSEAQAETLNDQQAWAEHTAREHGWTLTKTFKGTSTGKHGTRRLLQDLLTELRAAPKSQRPDRVLMIRLDRTGRGLALEPLAALAEIYRLGVVVHTRQDGDVSLTSASDTILPFFRVLTGALENEARQDKARSAHAKKRAEGKHAGHAPYGIVLVQGKPIAYEPEAKVVRELFALRLQGWGYHRLSRYAKEQGPPKRKPDGGFRDLSWDESTVQRLLATKTHRGVTVPEDLFDAVQGIRHAPMDRTAKHPWPLRGAVRCSCGRMLSVAYTGPKGKRIRYYMCRYAAGHERYPYHHAETLEAAFVDLLKQLRDHPDLLAAPVADVDALQAERDRLQSERDRIEGRKRKTWDLAEEGGISASDLRERIREISADQQRIEAELKRLESEITGAVSAKTAQESTAQVIGSMYESWPLADVETQREMAKAIAQAVGGLYVEPPEKAKKTKLGWGPISG